MRKFIRDNQKKLLAVFSAFLMVIFISQLAPNSGQQTNVEAIAVGTFNGKTINQAQLNNSAAEWQFIKQTRFIDPNKPDSNFVPLAYGLLGAQLAETINAGQASNSNAPLFYLLVQDAARQGVVVTKEQVESVITNNISPVPDPDSPERGNIEQAVTDCLMIKGLVDRAGNVVKITRPYQDLEMAQKMQILTVEFAPIVAARFMDKIPAPTDADIRKQFDDYSDTIAAQVGQNPSEFGSRTDPLGFGYKVPNRVQVQYIGLNYADVHAAAVASKREEEWDVEAVKEFKENRADYDNRPISDSTTQPSPQIGPTTHPGSATQPESGVRKNEDFDQDFMLHLPLVRDELYDRQTYTLQETIIKQINEKMSAGYGSYRDALASGAQTQTGPVGQYLSYKFLEDLAASIHSQFGVNPLLGNIEQVKTAEQLAQIEGIGKAVFLITGSNQQLPFHIYATNLFQPFLADQIKSSPLSALALVIWQPSNPLEDINRNLYIFRVSGSDAAHKPQLADVKEQVASDWKTSAAYAQALEAGRKLLSSAQRQGLDLAATEASLAAPILTEPFHPAQILGGNEPPVIAPLDQHPFNLKPDSERRVAELSTQLLTTSPGSFGRPQLLGELYADRMVAVVELHDARPIWEEGMKHLYTMRMAELLEQDLRSPLELALCAPQSVAERMNYVPTSRPSQGQ